MKHQLKFNLNPLTKKISYEIISDNNIIPNDLFEKSFELSDDELSNLISIVSERTYLIQEENRQQMMEGLRQMSLSCELEEYFRRDKAVKDVIDNQIKRFHNSIGFDISLLNVFIQKVCDKYQSKKYLNKEYSLGFIPRIFLLYFLLEYAEIYGIKVDTFILDSWTIDAYYIGDYKISQNSLQGGFINVEKCK